MNCTKSDFEEFMSEQVRALEHWLDDYIYYKGIEIHHNPLDDADRPHWLTEFVTSDMFIKCAAKFRREYYCG